MPSIWSQMGGGNPAVHINNVTAYISVIHTSGNDAPTIESNVQVPIRSTGVFSLMYFLVRVTNTTLPSTIKFRINGADGNQALSIPAGASGSYQDNVNTDYPTSGQLVNAQLVTNAILDYDVFGFKFAPDTSYVSTRICGFGSTVGISSNMFAQVMGGADPLATESQEYIQFQDSCQLTNLAVNCTAKARANPDTITLRINASNGNSTVSITGTGIFEDLSDIDNIVSGNNVNIAIVVNSGDTGNDIFSSYALDQISTNNRFHCGGGYSGQGGIGGTSGLVYLLPSTGYAGYSDELPGTESVTVYPVPNAGIVSNFGLNLSINTGNAAGTLIFRRNKASSSLVLSIGANATGIFLDSTDSVSLNKSDVIGLGVNTNAEWSPGTFWFLVSMSLPVIIIRLGGVV
jgi:hypothetical protein